MSPVRLTLMTQVIRKIHSCLKTLSFSISPVICCSLCFHSFQVHSFQYFCHYFLPGTFFHFFSLFFSTISFPEAFFSLFDSFFFRFQNSKKSVPLRGKQSKWVKNMHFPRKGTLFLLYWNLKNSKKSVPEENNQNESKNMHFPGKGTLLLLFWNLKNGKQKCTLTRKTVKMSQKTCIFLVTVHFFYYFEIWQIVKKSVPLRGKQSKWVKNMHFPRKGTLFFLFWNLKNSKTVYPYEENSQNESKTCIFRVRVHIFYYFEIWKIVKEVYPYEENSQNESKTCIFLVRVHFFLLFWNLTNS